MTDASQQMASRDELCKEVDKEMTSNEGNQVCNDSSLRYDNAGKVLTANERNASIQHKDLSKVQFHATVIQQIQDDVKDLQSSTSTVLVKEERDVDSIEEEPINISLVNTEPEGGWSFNVLHVESHDLRVVAREGFDTEEIGTNFCHQDGTQMHSTEEIPISCSQDVTQSQGEIAAIFYHQDGTQMQSTGKIATSIYGQDVVQRQSTEDIAKPSCQQPFASTQMQQIQPAQETTTSICSQERTDRQCTGEIPTIIRRQNVTQMQSGNNTFPSAEKVHAEASCSATERINKPDTANHGSSRRILVGAGNFQVQQYNMHPGVTPRETNKQEVAVQCQFPAQMPIPTDAKPFQCPTCFKTFAYKWSLKGHERIHTGYKPYKCKHCEKAFTKQDFLDKHERIHTGFKPYVCKYCERAFTQESNLTVHERIHTGVKPYNCKHCNKAFAQRSSLKTHERIHTGVKPYQCSFCKKLFAHQGNLKEHERIHTGFKPYKCSYCDKAFTARSNLDLHKRIHTGYKPHKCAHCEKTFLRQGNLEAHERTHTGVKPFKCKHCDKAFAQQGNLEKHERIHTGVRPYSCKLCNKEFSQQSHLKVHERLHTGEKPYKCKHCDMAFTFSGKFKKHELSHNAGVISTESS